MIRRHHAPTHQGFGRGCPRPQQAQPVPDDASVSGCLCLRLLIQHLVIQHFLSSLTLLQVEADDHRAATLPVLHRRLRRDLLLGALYCICTLYSRRGVPGYTRYLVATTLQALKQHNTGALLCTAARLAGAHRRVAAAAARARLRGTRRPRALRRRLHEPRADLALRALLLEVLPARRTQACDQARVRVWE